MNTLPQFEKCTVELKKVFRKGYSNFPPKFARTILKGHQNIAPRYCFYLIFVIETVTLHPFYIVETNHLISNKMSKVLAKPQLRGIAMRNWTRVLYGSLFCSCSLAVFLKYAILEKHKASIKKFYETYDVEKEYQAMKKAGVFKGFENGA